MKALRTEKYPAAESGAVLKLTKRLEKILLDSVADCVFATDIDGRIVYSNNSARLTRGYTKEEFRNLRLFDLVAPEFRHLIPERNEEIAKGEARFESAHITKDGRIIPVEVRAKHVVLEGETVLVSVCRNIEERKRAEAALKESEELFRAVVDQSHDGIAIWNSAGRVIFANKALERILSYPATTINMSDWPSRAFPNKALRAKLREMMARVREGAIKYFDAPVVRIDGSTVWVSFSITNITLEGKSYVLTVATDITESLRADQLMKAYEAEHRIAGILQEHLLPKKPVIQGVEVGIAYRPAFEAERVGGDFYDVFEIDDRLVAALIGDVSGKGIEAAGLSAIARSSVRTLACMDPSPSFVLSKTNHALLSQVNDDKFVTATFAVLDKESLEVRYASAGHPPGMVCGSDCRLLPVRPGLPLGIAENAIYREMSDVIDQSQSLVFYTDGLTEASNGSSYMGEEGVLKTVMGIGECETQELADLLWNAADDFSSGRLVDDVAVIVIRLSPKTR